MSRITELPEFAPEAASERRLSREEIALREVGQTAVTRKLAAALVAMFLATIVAVPLVQQASEVHAGWKGARGRLLPQAYELVEKVGTAARSFSATRGSWWQRIVATNRAILRAMHDYETDLKEDSVLTAAVLPTTQALLARLGAGNEQAYVGRDGWLFYRPEIDYVTGPGFLEASWQQQRAAHASEWETAPQPDPLAAIVQFDQQLAARGIKLIVVPTPTKASIQPQKFARAITPEAAPLQNVSFAQFKDELTKRGVLVFDPTVVLAAQRASGEGSSYLAADTHWRPEAMELVAREVAKFVEQHALLAPSAGPTYSVAEIALEGVGDIAAMLRLPERQEVFRRETVRVHQVRDASGALWRPARGADVLLLGDSFSNIYSLPGLGWGEGAGFAEHLSLELRRPLDTIVRNDGGAHATREILARDLAAGRDRLAGKRVVLWQFAARELTAGDWKLLELVPEAPAAREVVVPPAGASWTVSGVVQEISSAPRPGSVPYRDHIVSVHLGELSGTGIQPEGGAALVYVWSMRDNVLTEGARLRVGDAVRVRLRPWADVAAELERFNRSELEDEAVRWQEPCWGELIETR